MGSYQMYFHEVDYHAIEPILRELGLRWVKSCRPRLPEFVEFYDIHDAECHEIGNWAIVAGRMGLTGLLCIEPAKLYKGQPERIVDELRKWESIDYERVPPVQLN